MTYEEKVQWLRRYQDSLRREQELAEEVEQLHTRAGRALAQLLGELAGDLVKRQALAVQLAQALDVVVDERDAVPGRAADNAVRGQVELLLEGAHGAFGVSVENAVRGINLWDIGIIGRDAVEAVLDDAHLLGHIAQPEGNTRP